MTSTIEDLVYAVRDFIRTNYDTYLQAINDAKADGVTAESIKSANIEVRDADPYDAGEYPYLMLYPSEVNVEALSAGHDEMQLTTRGLIGINQGNESTLPIKMMRYVEALRAVLRDYHDLGETEFEVDAETSMRIYPVTAGQNIKLGAVDFTVFTDVAK
jgi:hypothetical protein